MTDKALREALRQQVEKQTSMRLPSNFAYNTLQRITCEQKVRERKEKIAAILTIAACTILGIVVIVWFYGTALKSAIIVMYHQPEGIALLPAMTFCAVFFTLLNLYLRRKYTTAWRKTIV